ncbi:AAA family ATPase [Actinokineospora iranica]|uniref:Predicted ATPase n=1 Tax=Actinokineospora iranica TaxID=1271860 RepID=A0A1G6R5U0_9PSEU|nr:AAA family ATPase [Actinokineospora iranica]SDC99831.1 Predicted ATPase [Actinokineospora iranica]
MADGVLNEIEVEGYTSIEHATIRLGSLNVLVGANGAGKSNFIRALELLGRIADAELGLFVGLNGGASALLNRKASDRGIKLRLDGAKNGYEALLVPAANDELIFLSETVAFRGAGHLKPYTKLLGRGHRESRLLEAGGDGPSVASYVLDLLHDCRVFHFHDTSRDAPVKQLVPTADNLALRNNAGNLAAVLLALRDHDDTASRAAYRRILAAIRQVAPFFRDFVLAPEAGDRIRLRWRQTDSDAVFSADQMSDGTLRFVCLATLLLQPNLPALLVLDEPELGLHLYAIVQLAGLLRQAATRSQVLLATQSVTLMNQFQIDDLIVVERVDGNSVFSRPDRERLSAWLSEYSLGELWEKNLIGGRPGAGGTSLHG